VSMSFRSPDASDHPAAQRNVQRLLIVRLGAMGDIIHTLPAATALRLAFPHAVLGWVVEERWAELLCTLPTARSGRRSRQRPLVDRMHVVNTAKWRKAPLSIHTWQELGAVRSDLHAQRYDVAVDFQGAARSSLIARWSRAPVVYGVAQPRENVASMFYTRQVIARGAHVVEQNLCLAAAVAGRPLQLPEVELPWDEAAKRACDRRFEDQDGRGIVIMNPGAGWGAKRWPAERYGEVARQLAKDGLRPLINSGPGEGELVRAVEKASNGAAEGIECSLTELIAVARRACLFIGGDTGPMHLAAALGVPVAAIFGPTDPARNGPYGTRSIVLRSPASTTSHERRAQPEEGLLEITSDQVIAAARRLLGKCRG
jgi:lipopolysaccharide heptosyltransferase I